MSRRCIRSVFQLVSLSVSFDRPFGKLRTRLRTNEYYTIESLFCHKRHKIHRVEGMEGELLNYLYC